MSSLRTAHPANAGGQFLLYFGPSQGFLFAIVFYQLGEAYFGRKLG